MTHWIRTTLALATLGLGACATTPGGGGATQPAALPAEYAAALDFLREERWEAAEVALNNYARKNPRRAGPQVNLALLYFETDRRDLAHAAIDKALAINPKQAAALDLRGILQREAGEFDAAAQSYRQAISADKRYPNAHLNLAILLDLYLHEPRRAVRHYRDYADLVGEENLDRTVESWIAEATRRAESGR